MKFVKRMSKFCENIGLNGLKIIEEIYNKKKMQVNILTHCNAGWLATIDWCSHFSIYQAHQKGIKVHVWVDETRPRNQGANLTSYEFNEEKIPNTVITDNAGGILMQRGQVDMCVGTDRTLSNGDVCNKVDLFKSVGRKKITTFHSMSHYQAQLLIGILKIIKRFQSRRETQIDGLCRRSG